MNKLTTKQKQELRGNLRKIEKVINDREQHELENGCVDYKLTLDKDNNLNFIVYCDDEIFENYTIELTKFDVKSILKSIINTLYENQINFRQNYIRKTKSFNNRKIKSLALWLERENIDRVDQINKELAERYNTTNKIENEVSTYKNYVRDLYNCLNILEPDWRIEDIKDYVFNKLIENNFTNVVISFINNRLIVQKIDDDKIIKSFEILIDNYSKKDIVFDEVKKQLEDGEFNSPVTY